MDYDHIRPIDYYESLDAFSNENGDIDASMPRAKWHTTFSDKGQHTIVESVIQYKSLADLEAVLSMGKEMTTTYEALDELLVTLNK
ncbi:hypothetical protein [Pedobacter sp. SYP-B3415]|uniref:hypothetical protein n=1 Tax=Pedobacter sp. SYP-B3415 TaxID=2496641 RepID=UPI001F10D076|nr:hypothetical protein [Pedobacter sp. SYP-B3415]